MDQAKTQTLAGIQELLTTIQTQAAKDLFYEPNEKA